MRSATAGYVDNIAVFTPATGDTLPQATASPSDDGIEQARHKIYTADLSFVKDRLVHTEGWRVRAANEAIKQYRNFLFLLFKHNNESLPPSKDIDEAWHAHILHTKQYRLFCQDVFGKFLEHTPSSESLEASFASTLRYYQQEFGAPLYGIRRVGWRYIKSALKRIWDGL